MYNNYANELVCDILEFVDNNINRKISIEEISDKFYYDRYYIMKLFKKELGITIFNYINYMRIRNSMYEIKNCNYSITRIAINNGFYSLEYFSEMFHKLMGVSPRIYSDYCKYRWKINEKDLNTINNHLIKIQEMIDFINKYKKNKKQKYIPVLKRSIFN